jgi:hypothetical protein
LFILLFRYYEHTGKDGVKRQFPRPSPILTDDAYPSKFPDLPPHLSCAVAESRRNPEERRAEAVQRDEVLFQQFLDKDVIVSYDCFVNNVKQYVVSSDLWQLVIGDVSLQTSTLICTVDNTSYIPRLGVCIRINNDLTVQLFVTGVEISASKLEWILGNCSTLSRWSQLENILSHYSHYNLEESTEPTQKLSCEYVVSNVVKMLEELCEYEEENNSDVTCSMPCILFCIEQLKLCCVHPFKRRYSSDLLRFAFVLFNRSSACYRILYGFQNIILPHPKNLKKLSQVLNVTPGLGNQEQIKYLKLQASRLSKRELYVVLQLDEIHVLPSLSYKGGSFSGTALNSVNEQAHTVQAFMISSVFGSAKEIVALFPVKCLVAEDLVDMIKKVITTVQECGFIIVNIVSDNNQVNAKAFASLCGDRPIEDGIINPMFPNMKIFIMYDTVHIVKCVRNNWLNQKANYQCFEYPQLSSAMFKIAQLLIDKQCPAAFPKRKIAQQITSASKVQRVNEQFTAQTAVATVQSSCEATTSQTDVRQIPWRFAMHQAMTMQVPWRSAASETMNTQVYTQTQLASQIMYVHTPWGHAAMHVPHLNCTTQHLAGSALSTTQIPDKAKLKCASFACLKRLYESECQSLIKSAPKLTRKSLYPTSLERQQVSLVMNIFNEYNIVALRMKNNNIDTETSDFIMLITAWFKIVNVKHSTKGKETRCQLSSPFSDVNDERFVFLEEMCSWLKVWGQVNEGKGCLSSQTLRAMHQTIASMINFIKYALSELDVSYVLLGKIQTDNLENRFGQYRQLCGGNYHISVQQVLEAEKKLRISSALLLSSHKHGTIAVQRICEDLATDNVDIENLSVVNVSDNFKDVLNEVIDCIFKCDEASLVYIAGYVVRKVAAKVDCILCINDIQLDRNLEISDDTDEMYQYVRLLDRGSLKYPTLLAVMVAYKVFCLTQILISKKYEAAFLSHSSQKSLLIALSSSSLQEDSYFLSETVDNCECGRSRMEMLKFMLPILTNIFLHNYAKMCNDTENAAGSKAKQRKLKTLTG